MRTHTPFFGLFVNQMSSKFESHPLAEIFPLMVESDLSELAANISVHGQRTDIVLLEGKILDGRNREAACFLAGREPSYREYDLLTEGDPLEYVWSMNYGRRHLTSSQRAMAAARYSTLKRGDNQHTDSSASISQSEAAKRFKVSPDSIQSAKKIQTLGVPKLIERVDSGDLSVSTGAFVAGQPRHKQMRLLSKDKGKIISIASRQRIDSIIKNSKSPVDLVPWSPKAKADDSSFCAFMEFAAESYRKLPGGNKYARMLDGLIEDIEEVNVSGLYKPIRDKILDAVDSGYKREADIRRCSGISKDEFEFSIKLLLNGRVLEEVLQGGKTEVARGQRNRLYQRVEKPADRDQTDDDLEDDRTTYDFEMKDCIAA